MDRCRSLEAFAILLLVGLPLAAGEIGPELWVDGVAGGSLSQPDVEVGPDGRRVYVWAGGGVDRSGIFLRRFDAHGTPLEAARLINTYTTDDQNTPELAIASDGAFVVVWQSDEPDPDVLVDRHFVRSQMFDSNGVEVGSEQLVSQLSSGIATDIDAQVVPLRGVGGTNAGFVVVWESQNGTGTDTNYRIEGRRLGSNGLPSGAQFQVNDFTTGGQVMPAITELTDGGYFVVWRDFALKGLRYDSAGQPVGTSFQVNTEFNSVSAPSAALGWDGRVLVVWEDDELSSNVEKVRARMFAGDLTPLGSDFRVSTTETADQIYPAVAEYGPLGFLVVWQTTESVGTDSDEDTIQARLVSGPSEFAGEQVQLNTFETGDQSDPAAHGRYGHLGVAWFSREGNDFESGHTITGLHIEHCIFCDDFEWGSAWRWSQVVE